MGLLDNLKNALGGKKEPVVPAGEDAVVSQPGPAADGTAAPGPGTAAAAAVGRVEASAAAGERYTVASGDTLWKIASQCYGDGSRYLEIYEANADILDSPDHILPGQELVIPGR